MKYKIIEKSYYNDYDNLETKYFIKKNYFNLFWVYCKDCREVNLFFQNVFFIFIFGFISLIPIFFISNKPFFYITETVMFIVMRYLYEILWAREFDVEYKAQNYLKNRMNEQVLKTKETIIEIK